MKTLILSLALLAGVWPVSVRAQFTEPCFLGWTGDMPEQWCFIPPPVTILADCQGWFPNEKCTASGEPDLFPDLKSVPSPPTTTYSLAPAEENDEVIVHLKELDSLAQTIEDQDVVIRDQDKVIDVQELLIASLRGQLQAALKAQKGGK
jgi:hypothetical protein